MSAFFSRARLWRISNSGIYRKKTLSTASFPSLWKRWLHRAWSGNGSGLSLTMMPNALPTPSHWCNSPMCKIALSATCRADNCSVLCSDAPLSLIRKCCYIDKHFEQHLYAIMQSLAQKATIILVSHEMSVISGMANRHIIVADGSVHECEAHHHFCQSECK